MPEWAELSLYGDFIDSIALHNTFTRAIPAPDCKVNCDLSELPGAFNIVPHVRGKELMLEFPQHRRKLLFNMGMSGTWAYLTREQRDNHEAKKHCRLSFESASGGMLFVYDQRHFAKWKWTDGWSQKRGPDPVREHTEFRQAIMQAHETKALDRPLCEVLMDQKLFNGIGNYLRSSILHKLGVNPFQSMNELMASHPDALDVLLYLCREVPAFFYQNGGGQIRDWKNPFGTESTIDSVLFYGKGLSCKDGKGRTFWFDPVWESVCPYPIVKRVKY